MKRQILFFILSSFTVGCNINKHAVTFGKPKEILEAKNDNVQRIFFDRNGTLYPDYPIDDVAMRKNMSCLANYYVTNTNAHNAICLQYNVSAIAVDESNYIIEDDVLQQEIIKTKVSAINKSDKLPVFIIHGYNDDPLRPASGSAYEEMKAVRADIESRYPDKYQFIEIYWDGLTNQNGWKMSKAKNAAWIWKYAQANAADAGMELRRILTGLKHRNIYILTHSHGAAVAVTSLFNVEKIKPCTELDELKRKFSLPVYDTPKQQYHVGMLVPAIPGENTFEEYYHRTINGKPVEDKTLKNYHFVVGFNRRDIVTTKFGMGPRLFGSTTLASSRRELKIVSGLMGDPTVFEYVDFSDPSIPVQRSHSWFRYCKSNAYAKFIDEVFREN